MISWGYVGSVGIAVIDTWCYRYGMKYNIPTERLIELYVNQQLPAEAIAKQVGMTANGIRYRLHRAGVAVRSQRHAATTEELADLYAGGMASPEIAQRTGMSPGNVLWRLRQVGVQIRHNGPNRNPTSTEELARLYFAEGLSPSVIAKQTGMTYGHVCKRLREAGYKLRYAKRSRWHNPQLRATMHPTTHDIAWAAGIYEGEGSCAFRRSEVGGNRGPQVSVTQKDPWLCHRLRALFGGSVGAHSKTATGKAEVATYTYWHITNTRALGFLMTIYKFLSPRRQERIQEAIAGERRQGNFTLFAQ